MATAHHGAARVTPATAVLLAMLLLLVLAARPGQAGTLTRAQLAQRFPALVVGERDEALPAWPLFRREGAAMVLAGYVFESIDLAPLPGFAGVPPNLLVAIDAGGTFLDVAVLAHHEPVFLEGLGEEPLRRFAAQYRSVSLAQNVAIDSRGARLADGRHAYLDGVAKATASIRIVNQAVLAAALQVARAKLGFAQGRDPRSMARVRTGYHEALDAQAMLARALVVRKRLANADVERLFAGSAGAGLDGEQQPDGTFVDLRTVLVSVPAIGSQLLDGASWRRLAARLEPGDHALLVHWSGRYDLLGEDFVRGSVPQRLQLRQDGLPLELRDLDLELRLREPAAWPAGQLAVFRVLAQTGLDPGRPFDVILPITRSKGIVYPERITRDARVVYALPRRFVDAAPREENDWRASWHARRGELAILGTAVAVLALALWQQRRLVASGWLGRFRTGYLLFTVGFIGYVSQAQLSIVNVTGAVQSLRDGRGLGYLLFDPPTLALWGCVLASLLIWGRGTFCGWLCPFGALQEFAGRLGRLTGLRPRRLRTAQDRRLKRFKYAVLAVLLAAALAAPPWAGWLAEVEPFKTAVTLHFARSWPFVLYAAGLLVLAAFVHKFFCRYLCPLGAALALLGRARLLDWIPRRVQCGTPCQTCRHRCDYQAIAPGGAVAYDECFQCLDCVEIHDSPARCAPLLAQSKNGRTIAIVPRETS
ncbi:4Fe-4S binding protein [Massilia sp. METH4]|uniref:4Fe-4S binding protein n=1 Tax=Massilia sp. METH4 TaxID=3123041 RepID=UPI0030D0C6EA